MAAPGDGDPRRPRPACAAVTGTLLSPCVVGSRQLNDDLTINSQNNPRDMIDHGYAIGIKVRKIN